jgi:cell division protein FtsX
VIATIALSALLFVSFVVLWLGQASRSVFTEGADSLAIRAVLRADVNNVGAELLAQRIREKVPDVKLEVITETIGRSLLALQEPWIAQMPDFEVTPLPVLIEIRHPLLLTNPAAVQKFVEELGQEPEVDFVAYNETAHNRLVKLAGAVGGLKGHTSRWMLSALALAGMAVMVILFAPLVSGSWSRLAGAVAVSWVVAWVLAWLVFRYWESTVVTPQQWSYLPFSRLVPEIAASLVLAIISIVLARGLRWRR